jgi:release factor glutamine methyltransferase
MRRRCSSSRFWLEAFAMKELFTAADLAPLDADGQALWLHWHGVLVGGLQTLHDKPEENSVSALRALWHLAAGEHLSVQAASERALPALTAAQSQRLAELVDERLHGTPLAHLTQRQRFMGLELLAGPQALIPRRETELLGHAAAQLLAEAARGGRAVLALDVCTGSGNLALGMAALVPTARVLAADLSPEAVALARQNVLALGLQQRMDVREGDLLAPFDEVEFVGQIDVLTCNPPYISSPKIDTLPSEIAAHEPRLAFDGGPFGIRILQRLIREAPRFVRPGGWLAFEVGLGQGPAVSKRLTPTAGYAEVRALADAQGEVRALLARTVGG